MAKVDEPLVLEERTIIGKGLSKLRAEGKVPAVIHNHGQTSVHVTGPYKDLDKVYKEAGKHHPLNLHVGDQKFLALIKDVHYHPLKRQMEHVVFQAIKQDEKVEAEIPVHLSGDIPAERVGLLVLHQLDTVQVEALPKDLPDELHIDGSRLVEVGDKLTVADLDVPEGVTIMTETELPIASVVEPRSLAAEEAAEAEAAEAAGEVPQGEEGETPAEGEAPEGSEGTAQETKE